MKVYVNIDKLIIEKVEAERPFFQASNFVDRVRLLFNKSPDIWAPKVSYLLANGRTVGWMHPAGVSSAEEREVDVNGVIYYYFDFMVSTKNGMLAVPGQLEITIALDYQNDSGTTTSTLVVGKVVNQVIKTALVNNNVIVVGDDAGEIVANFETNINNNANRITAAEARINNAEVNVSNNTEAINNLETKHDSLVAEHEDLETKHDALAKDVSANTEAIAKFTDNTNAIKQLEADALEKANAIKNINATIETLEEGIDAEVEVIPMTLNSDIGELTSTITDFFSVNYEADLVVIQLDIYSLSSDDIERDTLKLAIYRNYKDGFKTSCVFINNVRQIKILMEEDESTGEKTTTLTHSLLVDIYSKEEIDELFKEYPKLVNNKIPEVFLNVEYGVTTNQDKLIGHWKFVDCNFAAYIGTIIDDCNFRDSYGNQFKSIAVEDDGSYGELFATTTANQKICIARAEDGTGLAYNSNGDLREDYFWIFDEENDLVLVWLKLFAQRFIVSINVEDWNPDESLTFNLGSSSKIWKNLYLKNLYMQNYNEKVEKIISANTGCGFDLKSLTDSNNTILKTTDDYVSFRSIEGAEYLKVSAVGGYTKIKPPTSDCSLQLKSYTENNYLKIDSFDIKFYYDEQEVLKFYSDGLIMRSPETGKQILNACYSPNGGINIGNDQLDLVHAYRINIIPDSQNDVDYVAPSSYDRIKFGGAECVAEEGESVDIIMAYKKSYSEAEIVPFAITREGLVYYQGSIISSRDIIFEGEKDLLTPSYNEDTKLYEHELNEDFMIQLHTLIRSGEYETITVYGYAFQDLYSIKQGGFMLTIPCHAGHCYLKTLVSGDDTINVGFLHFWYSSTGLNFSFSAIDGDDSGTEFLDLYSYKNSSGEWTHRVSLYENSDSEVTIYKVVGHK